MREYTIVFRDVSDIAEFVTVANRHPSRIELVHEDSVFNAKSLLSLFCLQLHTPMTVRVYDTCQENAPWTDIVPFLQEVQPA